MKLISLFITLLLCTNLYAYTVTPIVQNFKASGKGSSKTFLIENPSKQAVSLEFEVTTRFINKRGEEIRQESEDFMVYPLQVTVKPESKRNIRVSWVGNVKSNKELPYRLIVRQLPIKSKKQKAGVNFMFEYVASLYVQPATQTKPKLVVSNLGFKKSKGKNLLRYKIHNQGSMHAILADYEVFITDGKSKKMLKNRDFVIPPAPNFLADTVVLGSIIIPENMNKKSTKLVLKKK